MIRRVGVICATIAVACLAVGLLLPSPAGADRAGRVQLSVDGAAFTAQPSGPLLDTTLLVPGATADGVLGIRSGFAVGTKLSLRLFDIHNDDNGCTAPESAVDSTCGRDQGELGKTLVVTLDRANEHAGPYKTVWTGTADQLAQSVELDAAVPAAGTRWLRVHASVPASVGNVIQSDTITFGFQVALAGNGVSGRSAVDGTRTSSGHHSDSGPSHGVDGLAATGVATVLLIAGGCLLVCAGWLVLLAGRRRRATSVAS